MTESLKSIVERDEAQEMGADLVAELLWDTLTDLVRAPADLDRFAPEVGLYFAGAYMQFEVGNGGFAQAAINIPEWFDLAATSYDRLGKRKMAAAIRSISARVLASEARVQELRAGNVQWSDCVGAVQARTYDALLEQYEEWEVDSERVEYMRANRDAFRVERP